MNTWLKLNTARTIKIALLMGLAGCSESGNAGIENACGGQLAASVSSLSRAAGDLDAAVNATRSSLLTACTNIATDLGATVPSQGNLSDDEHLQAVCEAAAVEIDAIFAADGTLTATIVAVPPRCQVDASAQFECEASCDVAGSCEPGTVEVRCEPGELTVVCEGVCEGTVTCEASANATVTCEGECTGEFSGTCDGSCTGTCDANSIDGGDCAGVCEGTCQGSASGECGGSCEVDASGSASCEGEVRCEGSCTGTATAPRCTGEIEPPSCNIDADCQAGCEGQANFNAECEPGHVTVVLEGAGNVDDLQATLEANLPAILAVRDGLAASFNASLDLGVNAANVVSAISDQGVACATAAGATQRMKKRHAP